MNELAVDNYIRDNHESFSIKCALFILDDNIETRTYTCYYPSALDYCLNEFYDATRTAINNFRLKLYEDKKSRYVFEEFKYLDYITFQKKEWEKVNIESPHLLSEFLDKVKSKLEETYDRFYRDAKIRHANKFKTEAVEETSLYLKGK